jgi:hypothetical protein
VALNVTPANGYTNHYICDGHLVALIETIFDDPEYGPIARKIARAKIAEYAEADALAANRAEAMALAEEVAAAIPVEAATYPCSKCGKPLKNPSARKIHEKFCKGNTAEGADIDYVPKDILSEKYKPSPAIVALMEEDTPEGCGY